jgi:PIN domain nuclease of toxin-antitoxin system
VLLLDTHVWLWLSIEPRRLSAAATAAIREALGVGGLAVASISLWEVAMMVAIGRILPHGTPERWLGDLVDRARVAVREITPAIATAATQFPGDFPADPADRLIAATARVEGLRLVTRDSRLRSSPLIRTIW